MSLIRRISTSITSSVDRAVSKVENHDAIINSALRDTQQAAARSRVRLERVRKDGHSLKTRHANLLLAIIASIPLRFGLVVLTAAKISFFPTSTY